jgi:hypothetical protein
MPKIVKLKRTNVAGSTPTLSYGEVAYNAADNKLFAGNAANQAVVVGAGGGGSANIVEATTAAGFPATGSAGTLYHATNVRRIYFWDSSGVYVEAGPSGGGSSGSLTIPYGGDPFFANVSLLLQFNDGSGSTIVDSSGTPKAITANGNATQSSTQSKWGGKSLYLDGTGDYVTAASMPSIGTSDFAVEMNVYLASTSAQYSGLYDQRDANDTVAPVVYLLYDTLYYYVHASNRITGPALSANRWYHIAIARCDGTTRMYVNGSQVGSSFSDSTNYTGRATAFIGSLYNTFTTNGYIDDVRVTVGSARNYIGDSIAVPAAPLPTAVDLTVTGSGGGSGSLSGSVTIPGMGDPGYASVSLLLHGNGNTNDSGPATRTGTATNVATNGAAKFGSNSLVFDGTSRLVYASNSAWNLPGDFTIEAWIYLTAAIGSGSYSEYALAAQWSGGGGLCWLWYLKSDGFSFTTGNGGAVAGYDNRGSVSLTANQWHHVAITRSGSTFSSYLNGSRFGTFSSSIDMSGNGVLSVGDQGDGVIRPFYGRIDEFRITKGVARYTGDSYTLPTAAFANSADLILPVTFS